MDDIKLKTKGRPPGTGSANTKLMRVIITPRQERLFSQIRQEIGGSESEHVRRALDDYLDKLITRGEIVDNGTTVSVVETKA